MNQFSPREDRSDLNELILQYENLKNGRASGFIEEESFERIIDFFEDKEDMKEALEACELGLSIFTFSASLMIKKANILLEIRQYDAALQILLKAESLDGMSADLCVLKTEAYLALDRQEEAIEFLNETLPYFEGEERIELLFELCDVYDDYEEFEKVFDVLAMILTEDPVNEEALYKICFWTDFTGRNEASIKLHIDIIDAYPYCELAWFNLGAAYQGLKLYEKAIDAYMYCIAIDEKFDYAYRNIGDAYIRLRKYKEAIEMLEKVLELSRPEEVIHDAIGYCYDKMNQWAQARFHYKKAVHLNPSESKLYYKIACTYHNEGRFDAAEKQLEQALKMNPDHADYNLAMGLTKAESNRFEEALPFLMQVIKSRPKNSKGWDALINTLMSMEEWEKAEEFTHAAYLKTNKKSLFLFKLVAIYFYAGKIKEALILLENCMEKDARMYKKLVEWCPQILQHPGAMAVISRFRKKRD